MAKYADIILPQMHAAFEGRDMSFQKERSTDLFRKEMVNLNGNYFVFNQKCVDPPGEVKARGWIWLSRLPSDWALRNYTAPAWRT